MKIPTAFLEEMRYSDERLEDKIIDHGRWSVTHRMVFPYEGKLYQTDYAVGATEYQDTEPFDRDDPIECQEVEAVSMTGIVYRPIE